MRTLHDFSVGAMRFAFPMCLALFGMKGQAAWSQTVTVQTMRGATQARAGELLIKFGSTPKASTLQAIRTNIGALRTKAAPINAKIGASALKSYGSVGWQLVKLPKGMSVEDGIKFYKSQPGVVGAEPNDLRYLKAVPNDPSYGRQYGLEKIGAPLAWNKTKGSKDVIVAVIDSGVNYTHEDLQANMWNNPKEVPNNGKDDDGNGVIDDYYGVDTGDNDGDPMDNHHHGSHCAGIIGAAGNNGTGISGVNWNVKIMACKVARADGGIPTSDIMESMQYVITMKARGNNIRVVSESLGGPSYNQGEKDLMDALGNAGIFVAAAAGNETTNNDQKPSYPANYDSPTLMSVAASGPNDEVAEFSNYGASTVDLAAPGVDIYSTFWPGNSNYSNSSGTSMATPMVAGAAALLCGFNPSITPVNLKKILMDTVDPFTQWEGKVVSGGRMNLARALQAIDPNGLPTVNNALPRAVTNTLKPAFVVNFSKPMNTASVQNNFSVTPSVAGSFSWSNNNQTMTFIPTSNLTGGNAYQGRIKGEALSANNLKLDGNLSQTSTGSPSDDYVWTFRIEGRPSNDNFANALPLTGETGSVPSHNYGTTRETGEPRHGNYYGPGDKSVWFKWTAPATGNVIFNTKGTTMSHVIAAYSGSSLTNLVSEAQNDTYFGDTTIQFRANVGVTYTIAIDGIFFPQTETTPAFTDTGNIGLNWIFHRSPANDNYSSAQAISGAPGSAAGNTLGAYYETGESSHIGYSSSVWYKWTAPANGAVVFDTYGSGFDTTLCAFTGTNIGSAQLVAQSNTDGNGSDFAKLPFTVVGGTTYYITVGGAGYAFSDARGDFKLSWRFANAPSNDHFASAAALTPVTSGSISGNTYGATVQLNEPEVNYRDGLASIWYSWTAPSSGLLTLETLGSEFDTNLAVFTGSVVTNLTEIDSNDDDESIENRKTSRIKFTAVGGTKYWVRIDSPAYASTEASVGYPSTHGATKLTWAFTGAPSNDLFANAQLITGNNGRVIGTSIGANVEANEPQPTFRDYGSSIWYKWVAPANGAVSFDTYGSTLVNGTPTNTHLAIYRGTQLQSLTDVDYNDDNELNSPTESSRVRFTVVSGTTYFIRIDNNSYAFGDSGQAYDASHGNIALQWDYVGAPSNDNFSNAVNLTPANSGRVAGTTIGANLEAGEENPTFGDHGYSIWYKWTSPGTGPVTFSTEGSTNLFDAMYDTHLAIYQGTSVASLTWIDQNGDDGNMPTSKLTIDVEGGQTYFIRVDQQTWNSGGSGTVFNNSHGRTYLSWSFNGATINAPAITSFTPASGQAGTVVTLRGTNLDGTNAVYFDGIQASVSSVSATAVVVTAPTNVHTGRITLVSPRGSAATDADFIVGPAITSFTPASGNIGTQVTITGRNFYGVSDVTFAGVSAAFKVNSTTQIVATVPEGAVTGKIAVVTTGGTIESATNFSLPPRILSFSPPSGEVGTTVVIKGVNFIGVSDVLFNGVKSTGAQIAPDQITVDVPATATTGQISVATPLGTVKTATNFVVIRRAAITSFSPSVGKVGTQVIIKGTAFTGATAVRFNGVAATSPTIADTQITAVVPSGASTGPIVVTTPDGEARSATDFIVDGEIPAATISAPANGQSLNLSAFTTISGTATDNVGVGQLLFKLFRTRNGVTQYWNGTAFTSEAVNLSATLAAPGAGSTNWNYPVSTTLKGALDAGNYTLFVYARDTATNQAATVSSNFALTVGDSVKPVVSVTSPTLNQGINGSAFTGITGSASDDTSVKEVLLKLVRTRNGVVEYWNGTAFTTSAVNLNATLASPNAKTTTWNFAASAALKAAFDHGIYTVFAYVRDAAGNLGQTVVRDFRIFDDEKPVGSFASPVNGQNLPIGSFNALTGGVTDNSGVREAQFKILRVRNGVTTYWTGTSFSTTHTGLKATVAQVGAKSTTWNYSITPAMKTAWDSGLYQLYLYVWDVNNNQGETKVISFTLSDGAKPGTVITSPTPGQSVAKSSFNAITGTATDDMAVKEVLFKIFRTRNGVTTYWNGTAFTTTHVVLNANVATPNGKSTAWNYAVSTSMKAALDAGAYSIVALSKDATGKQSDQVTVNFSVTASLAGGTGNTDTGSSAGAINAPTPSSNES